MISCDYFYYFLILLLIDLSWRTMSGRLRVANRINNEMSLQYQHRQIFVFKGAEKEEIIYRSWLGQEASIAVVFFLNYYGNSLLNFSDYAIFPCSHFKSKVPSFIFYHVKEMNLKERPFLWRRTAHVYLRIAKKIANKMAFGWNLFP